jgi:2-polyprenyl-3-methyl-5-hydroxy-6-metoxy-1,4-benzoquinol methylase
MTSRSAKPRASLESVRTFWSSHVNNEYYTAAERGSDAYFREIEERRYAWHYHLRDLFGSLAGSRGRLLEIGSGIGVDSIRLARCGFDVTAVDLTPEAIETARAYATARDVEIDFRVGNAESLDFPDATFDVVYSFGVLHHTPDIYRAIAEVHRVLKPDGTAYVMLYHRFSIVNLAHRVLRLPYESPRNRRDDCPVVDTFSRRSARALFRSFSSVQVRTAYPFTFGFGRAANMLPLAVRRTLGRLVGWHLMICLLYTI